MNKVCYNDDKIIGGCGLSAMIDVTGGLMNGGRLIDSIANMHDRGNGLGGGFAIYGCYPEYKDYYALHCFFEDSKAADDTEDYLNIYFYVDKHGALPHRHKNVFSDRRKLDRHPLIRRYFVKSRRVFTDTPNIAYEDIDDDEFVVRRVMEINSKINGAYIFSSGKNMGVFKGVGYPEDIANFFMLDNYKGYLWTAHNRFPTNSPSWWGGAHPFALLDYTVVHNGEISSYGINKRYLEMYDYEMTCMTDTEVIVYIFDLLVRKHKLPLELVCKVLSPDFWKNIDKMPANEKQIFECLRMVYGSISLNGPFAIVLAFNNGMIGLNDRIKLRPLVAAEKGNLRFFASEESAIMCMVDNPDRTWHPKAGEPTIFLLNNKK